MNRTKNIKIFLSRGGRRGLVVERTPGDQGSNPSLGKNFLAIYFTASKFAAIVWSEVDIRHRNRLHYWIADKWNPELDRKKYYHNITQL